MCMFGLTAKDDTSRQLKIINDKMRKKLVKSLIYQYGCLVQQRRKLMFAINSATFSNMFY